MIGVQKRGTFHRPHPSSNLHSQGKVLLDFSLFPGISNPVDNYIWSAGALLPLFFLEVAEQRERDGDRA